MEKAIEQINLTKNILGIQLKSNHVLMFVCINCGLFVNFWIFRSEKAYQQMAARSSPNSWAVHRCSHYRTTIRSLSGVLSFFGWYYCHDQTTAIYTRTHALDENDYCHDHPSSRYHRLSLLLVMVFFLLQSLSIITAVMTVMTWLSCGGYYDYRSFVGYCSCYHPPMISLWCQL